MCGGHLSPRVGRYSTSGMRSLDFSSPLVDSRIIVSSGLVFRFVCVKVCPFISLFLSTHGVGMYTKSSGGMDK